MRFLLYLLWFIASLLVISLVAVTVIYFLVVYVAVRAVPVEELAANCLVDLSPEFAADVAPEKEPSPRG